MTIRELKECAEAVAKNKWMHTATIAAWTMNAQGRQSKKWLTAEALLRSENEEQDLREEVSGKELQAMFLREGN